VPRVGVGLGMGQRVVSVVGRTVGKGDGHPVSLHLESSSDPSTHSITPLHRRSPLIHAP